MSLQGECITTPASPQFLHDEQHVYLTSRILLATFSTEIFYVKSHLLAGRSLLSSLQRAQMILSVPNKQNFVILVICSLALIALAHPLTFHHTTVLCFLGLGFTSVPQLWEYTFPYISPLCLV